MTNTTNANNNTSVISFLQSIDLMKKSRVNMNDIANRMGYADSSPLYKKMKKIQSAVDDGIFNNEEEEEIKALFASIKSDSPLKGAQKFLITSAMSNTPTNKPMLISLQHYAKEIGAKLVVLPVYYRNISLFEKRTKEDTTFATEVMPYMYDRREQINKNLMILGDFPISATAKNPLTGLETITGDSSGIFGHTTISMNSVATPSSTLPKLLYTTGTVSMQNYSNTKTGSLADHHHNFGALIVEVENSRIFHVRQIEWSEEERNFYDIGYRVTPKGAFKDNNIEALVMGDLHVKFISQDVVDATFGKNGILSKLKTKHLVLHDALDMYSGSHHHDRSPSLQYKKQQQGLNNVRNELDEVVAFHEKYIAPIAKKSTVLYVDSNHNRHLDQWLDNPKGSLDAVNAKTYHYLNFLKLDAIDATGRSPDTLELFMQKETKNMNNVQFVTNRKGFRIKGIDVSLHGDIGTNGSRGSRQQYTKIGCDVIVGHSHSPGITLNSWQVGTSSILELEYNNGPSSWLNTHCIVYPNGKRSLINIIDGKWCK